MGLYNERNVLPNKGLSPHTAHGLNYGEIRYTGGVTGRCGHVSAEGNRSIVLLCRKKTVVIRKIIHQTHYLSSPNCIKVK